MSRHLTTSLALPYYDSDDPPDGATQQADLAQTLDTTIGVGGIAPVGAMFMWPVAAAPTGFLLMQGQQVAASTYPLLAALLGQDAGGKVTIPDMRDVFPVGAGATMALGSNGGASSVALTVAQLPAHSHGGKTQLADRSLVHSHTLSTAGQGVSPGSGGGFNGTMSPNSGVGVGASDPASAPDHQHVITAEGGGATHENRPPYRAVNFIMRAG
jgi:microcystin-dependent protein